MKKILTLVFTIAMVGTSLWAKPGLKSAVQKKVVSSVFEIVVDKIEDEGITYERELPFERLPYAIRNDKYNSIGTAFLLDNGTFYSASHVFNLYGDSVYANYYIRDNSGNVYKIDEITSLSNTRDFISFTVPEYKIPAGSGLKISTKYDLNMTVFAVGNALGEGIIIRDGVLTSETPEHLNGEWNWLRFSAPASPGNSGGPLIKADGSVIGLITMKNETENLNYALPIAEIESGKDGIGRIFTPFYYRLPNIQNYKEYGEYKNEIALPAKYEDLHKELTSGYKDCLVEKVKAMRAVYEPGAPKAFDNSREFPIFTYSTIYPDDPLTVYLGDSGDWDYGCGQSKRYQLEDNGHIDYSSILGYYIFNLVKPDSVSLEELLSNPKMYMDYLARLLNLYRSVANENVTVTSLGEPCQSETYRDAFGRTWLVNYFSVDFADCMICLYALPLPKGLYIIYKLDSRSAVTSSHFLDMQFVADYTYLDYCGLVKEWKEYLALPESVVGERADFEKALSMDYSEEKLSFTAGDMTINLTPEVLAYDDETRINIANSYIKVDGKTQIENRSIVVYSKPKSENYKYAAVKKIRKPIDGAQKETIQDWEQNLNQVAPLDGEPYNYEQYTYLNRVKNTFKSKNDTEYLYQLAYEVLNQNKNEEIKAFADQFENLLEVK